MTTEAPRPTGLKPTIRQLAILVLWAAIVFAVVRALAGLGVFGFRTDFDCLLIPLLASAYPLPMLGVMLAVLDRPGPVRHWYRALCLVGFEYLAGILFLLQEPVCLALTGRPTPIFFMAPVIGVVALRGGWKRWQLARPAPCPRCGRRAVITLRRPALPGSRRMVDTGKAGWCATCGAEYQRAEPAGPWQPLPEGGV